MRYLLNRISCLLLACCAIAYCMQAQDDSDDMGTFDVELGSTFISNMAIHRHGESAIAMHSLKNHRIFPEHRHNKKYQSGKHHPFKVIVPQRETNNTALYISSSIHNPVIPPGYQYLFFREINPPPPRHIAC